MKVIFSFHELPSFCGDDHHSLCDIFHSEICSIRIQPTLVHIPNVVVASIMYMVPQLELS